jgi:hypothetical protein
LGNRGNVLTSELEEPIIVPHAAQKNDRKVGWECKAKITIKTSTIHTVVIVIYRATLKIYAWANKETTENIDNSSNASLIAKTKLLSRKQKCL